MKKFSFVLFISFLSSMTIAKEIQVHSLNEASCWAKESAGELSVVHFASGEVLRFPKQGFFKFLDPIVKTELGEIDKELVGFFLNCTSRDLLLHLNYFNSTNERNYCFNFKVKRDGGVQLLNHGHTEFKSGMCYGMNPTRLKFKTKNLEAVKSQFSREEVNEKKIKFTQLGFDWFLADFKSKDYFWQLKESLEQNPEVIHVEGSSFQFGSGELLELTTKE